MAVHPVRAHQAVGRPGTQVVPSRWSEAPRVIVGKTFTACCEIRRPDGVRGTFDQASGSYPDAVPAPPHYRGGCRVQVLTGDEQARVSAEEPVATVGYLVVVDLNAGTPEVPLSIDDVLTVTDVDPENGDVSLIGRVMTVYGIQRGSLAWERDLTCVDELRPNEHPET